MTIHLSLIVFLPLIAGAIAAPAPTTRTAPPTMNPCTKSLSTTVRPQLPKVAVGRTNSAS